MPRETLSKPKANTNDSGLNFEARLWAAADKMRGHMDASEYNGARPEGLCLGLIFLKYISDAFEEKREQLLFGCPDSRSEWFIKDEPQRAEVAENRDSLSAAIPFSASDGEKVAQPDEVLAESGLRCRHPRMNRRSTYGVRGKKCPRASTTTWKLARMNLAIRGIDVNLGPRNADSFRQDLHPDLKADFAPVRKDLANPPFNRSDWDGESLFRICCLGRSILRRIEPC